jgi:disulfide bond formation protein DsbB
MAVAAQAPRLVKTASVVVFLIAAATILAALAFEHFGGYVPCPLCLQQRYAYYFAVPASAIAFFLAQGTTLHWARILLILIAVAFALNAVLGIYHSGVEWKWWPGPDTCGTATQLQWGEGGLAQQLETARMVACDEAPWRFLGLSFAGWNAVMSAFLAGVAAMGAAQRR